MVYITAIFTVHATGAPISQTLTYIMSPMALPLHMQCTHRISRPDWHTRTRCRSCSLSPSPATDTATNSVRRLHKQNHAKLVIQGTQFSRVPFEKRNGNRRLNAVSTAGCYCPYSKPHKSSPRFPTLFQ